MNPLFILLIALASMSQPDNEELPHYWLPEIVVTAKRISEPLQDVAVDMKVLTAKDISQRGIRTLSQLFVEEGILDTRVTGVEGGLLTLGLRGFPADHVLVMLNGTVVNSPSNGSFDFSEIPLSSISRIEIVKGPASSYYGAYASSGVINIITKQQTEDGLSLAIEGNVTETAAYHAYTGAAFRRNAFASQFFVSRRKNDGERLNSDFESISGGGYLSYDGIATVRFSMGERDVGVPGPVPDPDFIPAFGDSDVNSLFDSQKNNHAAGSVQFEKSIGHFGILAIISYRKEHLVYNNVYEDWLTYNRLCDSWYYNTETMVGSAQVSYWWLSVGLDAQNQEFWAYDTLTDADADSLISTLSWNPHRKNKGVWGSIKAPLFSKKLIPSVSVRWDKNSDYDDFISSSGSVMFKPKPFIRIGASAGKGIRPPTFNELYWPGAGNPELKPQESTQLNSFVDVNYKKKFFMRVSGFKREVKEAIAWINFKPENIDRMTSKGIELHPEFRPVDLLSISLTAVFMKTEEERITANPLYHWVIDGKTVAKRRASYIPETKFAATLIVKPMNTTSVTLSSVYTGDRIAYFYDFSASDYKIKCIEPVTLYHTCILQEIAGPLTLSLRIDNILDTKHPSNFGYTLSDMNYPAPGRNISLGLRYSL